MEKNWRLDLGDENNKIEIKNGIIMIDNPIYSCDLNVI